MVRALHQRWRELPLAVILAAGLGVLFSACGGSKATTIAPPAAFSSAATTVIIRANDFQYQADKTTVPAGPVHFAFTNQSKTYQHELWVFPQDQPKLNDMLAAKDASKNAGSDVNEEDFLQGIAGKVDHVAPGKTAAFDATLQPGTYEMACFIITNIGGKNMVHYEMGMHTLLTVQ